MKKESNKISFVNWNGTPWKKIREGVELKIFSGEGATLQLARLKPGHALRPHKHPYEQIVYVLSGTADFHIEKEVFPLVSESCIVVPPNLMHYAVVTDKREFLALDVFIPRKEDESLYTELKPEVLRKGN